MNALAVRTEASWQIETWAEPTRVAEAGQTAMAALYQRVGLTALAQRTTSAAQVFGHRLSSEELAVWTWRYPTVYQHGAWVRHPLQTRRDWDQLEWPVPAHVCGLIQHCLKANVFPTLEIWTPELRRRAPRTGPTPILVGWLNGDAYLLARWAEALEPFEEIARKARSWRGRQAMIVRNWYGRGDATLYLAGVPLTCGSVAALFSGHLTDSAVVGLLVFGVGVATAITLMSLFAPFPNRVRQMADRAGWVLR